MIPIPSRAADGLTTGLASKADTTTPTAPKPRKDSGTYQSGLASSTRTTRLEIENEQYQSASASPEDSLCDSCSKINFELRPYTQCNCHGSVVTGSTISATLSKKNCPSCRLITHLISFYPTVRRILPESQITLWVARYRMDNRSKLPQTDEISVPRCIEVHLCMHKQGKEDEGVARKCSVIGLLLPTRKPTLPKKTRLQRHDELFSTLAYDNIVYARQTTYTVDVELLKVWMSFCGKSHSRCKNNLPDGEAKTSLRLIDVLEQRLVKATFDKDYVALSYVWGKGKNEVLLRGTIEQFQQAGSLTFESVPRIVADVMQLVAALGERYLWVDTACIIQDDSSDKQRQLPIMSSIYSYAKLTIIAAVNNAKDPLPRWKQCSHNIGPSPELLNGVPYTTALPHLTRTLSQTTWSQRGWTFQEGLLARRALVFTQELVY